MSLGGKEVNGEMRRIVLSIVVALVMAAMMASSALPAFARGQATSPVTFTCTKGMETVVVGTGGLPGFASNDYHCVVNPPMD